MSMDRDTSPESTESVDFTARIVAAYVSNNTVPAGELPDLIQSVQQALTKAAQARVEEPKEELKPAVSVRKSVNPDYIVCLECGKKFKSLKRHLRTHHDLSPQEYRERWNLPYDYPMVAPNYAAARSEMAKKIGLGQTRQQPAKGGGRRRGK